MTEETNHLDAETLSAYSDGELNAVAAARVERHLADCAVCTDTLRRVREVVTAARALPRDIAPPPEGWTALRDRVAREPAGRYIRARWWHNGWLAAAAAIVLVLGTALLTSNTAGKAKAAKLRPTPVATGHAPASGHPPVILVNVDNSYAATLAELRETLDSQRATLSPSTVRTVERSLAIIDTAIAEARDALASDPANQSLVDILSAHYERKVELLQRATELSSSL
jgi:anti-sigma factor ChrR (cupin superfamily)